MYNWVENLVVNIYSEMFQFVSQWISELFVNDSFEWTDLL